MLITRTPRPHRLLVRFDKYHYKRSPYTPQLAGNFFHPSVANFRKMAYKWFAPRGRSVASTFFSFVAPLLRQAPAEKSEHSGVYIEGKSPFWGGGVFLTKNGSPQLFFDIFQHFLTFPRQCEFSKLTVLAVAVAVQLLLLLLLLFNCLVFKCSRQILTSPLRYALQLP